MQELGEDQQDNPFTNENQSHFNVDAESGAGMIRAHADVADFMCPFWAFSQRKAPGTLR